MHPRQLQRFRYEVFALAFAFLGVFTGPAYATWTDTPSAGLQTTDVGLRPQAVAVHAQTRLAVVANEEGSAVSLVNIDTGTTTASIPVAESPIAVAIDATKALAYVLHKAGAVSVIDLNAGVRTVHWSAGSGEFKAIVVHPSGHELALLAEDSHRLIRLDATTGTVKQVIPLSEAAEALAFAPDGAHLYLATDDTGLRVYETTGWTELAPIAVDDVKAIGDWPEGQRLIAIDKRQLHIINPVTKAIDSISVGAGLRRVTIDGLKGIAYVADKDTNAVAAIDLTTKTYQGRFSLNDEPADLAADASTGKVLVALKKANRLLRLDPAIAALTPSVYLGEKLRDVAVDDDAHRAIAIADHDRAFVIKLDDKTHKEVTLPSKPLVVAADASRGLAVIGLEKGGLRFLDLATQTLAPETVSLESKPVAIAIDPSRGLAVLAVDKKDQLLLIDIANRTLLKTITTAGDVRAVAVHSGHAKAYALKKDKGQSALDVIDLASQAITGSIAVHKHAKAIVIDDALDLAVLALEESNKVEVLDLKTGETLRRHELHKHPHALALNRDTHTVVIAAKDSDQIALLDLTTQTLTPNFASLDKPQRLDVTSRDNQALVIAGEQGEIVFVQLPNPVPVLSEIVPPDVTAPAPSFALLAVGQHFINSSKVTLNDTALTTRWKDHQHLEADVPANLLSAAGVYPVKVVTPGPAGGESQTINFTVNNPVPVLTAISPVEILAGSPDRALTVTGQNFVATSVVRLGIADLVTTFVDEQHLTAVIPAAMLANPAVIPVTVFNPVPGGGSSNPATLTVLQAGPRIESVTPSSGEPGDLITIAGSGFEPLAMENQVIFGGNVAGVVQVATATELRLTVPPGAVTGPITVKTAKGEAKSPVFTVNLPEDFELIASPATVTLIQNASNTFSVQLTSTGTQSFTSLVRLAAQGLPEGVTPRFSPQALTAHQTVALTLGASGAAVPETFTFTIEGRAVLNGRETVKTAQATVSLLEGGQTGVKGRFVDPEGRGISGVYVRYETLETTSDAAGNFLLTGLPVGKVTLRMDATPANPLFPIWPSTIETQANEITVLPDWPLLPPPSADQLKPIDNATQDQDITDERYPGLAIKLPKGVTITGWDGVVKDRIAVERLDPDKLGVVNPPIPTKSVYQLFFGTPMGGIPSAPIPVTLPNDVDLEPGQQTELWYFDGSPMGGEGTWKKAGTATVSADGTTVSSDPGSGIPRFCGKCGLLCISAAQENDPNPKSCPEKTDDPIILSLGMEAPDETDVYIGGRTPIRVSRSYSPYDAFKKIAGVQTSLGLGWVLEYDVSLFPLSSQLIRVVLPGNARVHFTAQGDGQFVNDGEYIFQGAVISKTATGHELRFKNGSKWVFKAFSNTVDVQFLTEQRDATGGKVLIGRDSDGKIISLQNDSGRRVSITQGSNGYISKITDAIGRTVEYGYQGDLLVSVKDLAGGTTTYQYEQPSNSPPSLCTAPAYVPRITEIRYPGQTNPVRNIYGASKRVLKQIQPDGTEIKFAYQLVGACVASASSLTPCTGATCPTVDSWENQQAGYQIVGGTVIATTVTDAKGNSYTYRFNPAGRPTEFVDALGQSTKYTRNFATNRVTQEADALGRITRYFYDTRGNLIRTIDPENRIIDYEYDLTWNQVSRIIRYKEDGSPLSIIENTYAPNTGVLTTVKDANVNSLAYTYTPRGQVKSIIDALGNATSFTYSDAGDLTAITDALGNTRKIDYDLVGRSTKLTDALGQSTLVAYNNRDQATQITDALKGVSALDYDLRGNLKTVTNPNQQLLATYDYNEVDELLKRTDGAGKDERYTYDANGNVETYTDRKGLVTRFTYDQNDRVTEIAYADGTKKTYAYDAAGRLTSLSDPSGTLSFTYDNLDRLVQETSPHGWVRYSYDALGRRVKLETPHQVVNYTYDDAGNLTKITQGEEATEIAYDANNRRSQLTYPNGVVATYAYDKANRLAAITYKKGETAIESLTYVYDPSGRVVQRARTSSAASKQEAAKSAAYDPKTNRLLSLTTAAGDTESFTYDDNGNLTTHTHPCGTTSYTWDPRDRLTQIAGFKQDCSPLTASFQYDAVGRRTETTINGKTKTYLYDGLDVIAEIGHESAQYLRTDNVDEAIARYDETGSRYYLTEILGSTQILTDAQGNTTHSYSYSPYGETAAEGETSDNPVQYTGRENDGTGLYYYRARYYAPQLARFISEDPIGFEGGLNVYEYVGSSPINSNDPSGLIPPAAAAYAAASAYLKCVAECEAMNALADALGGPFCELKDDNCYASCANPLNWIGGKYAKAMAKMGKGRKKGSKPNKDVSGRTPSNDVPQNARDVAERAKGGSGPLPGHKGGTPFLNDGRGGGQVLPRSDSSGRPITYTEYDIHPHTPGVNRGPERVVVGSDGRAYYTSDHYKTFTPLE